MGLGQKVSFSTTLIEYSLYAFYLLLPFNTQLSNIIIIFLLLIGLSRLSKNNIRSADAYQISFSLISILFFLLHLVYYQYAFNKSESLGGIERKLSFIAFPFIYLAIRNDFSDRIRKNCHRTFVASLLILCGFLFAYRFYFYNNQSSLDFSEENITLIIDLHRVYFTFYLFFGILILLEEKVFSEYVALKAIMLITFFIYIILLGSRLFTLLGFIYILFKLYQYLSRKKSLPVTFGWIAVTLIAIVTLIFQQPFLKNQYSHLFQNLDKGKVLELSNGVNNRLLQWECALKVIKEHWLLGVTPGDTIDTLVQCYKSIQFNYGVDMRFNAHNQFLQNWISLGLAGLFLTAALWAIFFIKSIKLKSPYLIWVSIALLLFLNTECLLDRQAGVVFVMGILAMELFSKKDIRYV